MLLASPLGVAASQMISGAPWPCTGGTSRKHITNTTLRISIEHGFIINRYSPNLILGQVSAAPSGLGAEHLLQASHFKAVGELLKGFVALAALEIGAQHPF